MRGLTLGDPALLGAAAGFSPLSLSPALWLDASDAATITSSGGLVSSWADKSGNGRNVTQGTSTAQPGTGAVTQNGRNVLTFDGGDSLVSVSAASTWKFLHDGTQYMVAIVALITNPATNGTFLSTRTAAGSLGFDFRRLASTNISHVVQNAAVAVSVNQVASNSSAMQAITVFGDPSVTPVSGRSTIFVNGGTGTSANTESGTPTSSDPPATLFVGNRSTNPVPLTGRIAEIVIVSGANATEANRVALRDYLNAKWAVY